MGASSVLLPLAGKRIAVTRASEQSAGLMERLRLLGAEPVECAAISIAPLLDFTELDRAIRDLPLFDWVVFTSVNGVSAFTERMGALGVPLSALCSRKLAAIGPATSAALQEHGCTPDFVPDSYVAEAVVEQIGDVRGKRVLLPRADIARKALAQGLRDRGADVLEVDAYRTVGGEGVPVLADLLERGAVDAVTFTSSSTVRYTLDGLAASGLDGGRAVQMLNRIAVVCIGPITAQTARERGLHVHASGREYTTEGLVEALVAVFSGENERKTDA